MKKIISLQIFILVFYSFAFSQWEFNYFAIKGGAIHNFYSLKPAPTETFYLKTPDGYWKLKPDTNFYSDYVLGGNIQLDFHIDMPNDKLGFIFGLSLQNKGYQTKFLTTNNEYFLYQTYRITSVSFPAYIKFGKEIFDLQHYGFIGARFDINLGLLITDKASYSAVPKTLLVAESYFTNNNLAIVAGYNFFIFNFELDFYLSNFMNPNYEINIGTNKDPYIIKPFENYPKFTYFFTTSINIPLSPWTKTRIYFLRYLFR